MSGQDFQDFVVVVTGGSTGLGRAIAVETASRGAGVVVINYASSQTEAEETARQVREVAVVGGAAVLPVSGVVDVAAGGVDVAGREAAGAVADAQPPAEGFGDLVAVAAEGERGTGLGMGQ